MTLLREHAHRGAEPGPGASTSGPVPSFDARTLLGDEGLAEIMLGDQRYLLRLTKAGKLILTK